MDFVFSLFASMYLADFISGIVHLYLDYSEIKDMELRLHLESTIPDVHRFKKTSKFKNASPNDQYLWNFHVHHDAPYPSCDSNSELFLQILRPLSVPFIGVLLGMHCEMIPILLGRILLLSFCLGSITQFTHFLAHARSRGLVDSHVIKCLQDWHIILHPDVHRVHHEEFDCNFCILNGWANPLVNGIRKLLSRMAIYPDQAPTVTTRILRRVRYPR